jgi:shikimate dehydrogenase
MIGAREGYVLGIVGSRQATDHSLSPSIHSYLLGENGLSGVYLRFPVEQGRLHEFFDVARFSEADGFNITMPYKEEALAETDALDRVAEMSGAVNTVVRSNGRLVGYNTDAMALSDLVASLRPETALIFGSGGAARAAAYSLRNRHVSISARNGGARKKLADQFGFEEFNGSSRNFDILVNCTPVGMGIGSVPGSILGCRFGTVIDFVYSEGKTPFSQLALEQSSAYIGGLEILARQAVRSFRLWTGCETAHDQVLAVLGGAPAHAA